MGRFYGMLVAYSWCWPHVKEWLRPGSIGPVEMAPYQTYNTRQNKKERMRWPTGLWVIRQHSQYCRLTRICKFENNGVNVILTCALQILISEFFLCCCMFEIRCRRRIVLVEHNVQRLRRHLKRWHVASWSNREKHWPNYWIYINARLTWALDNIILAYSLLLLPFSVKKKTWPSKEFVDASFPNVSVPW